MNQPPDPFEFLKNLWGSMGLPLAGVMSSALDQGEIERRIAELKSVESWLNLNLNVLRMTIQGLEMQKSGLAAMQEAGAMGNKAQDPAHPAGDRSAAPAEARSNTQQPGREDPSKK